MHSESLKLYVHISVLVIASNFQTCLGLLMHYPPIGDINSLLQKALFLRDPKVGNHSNASHLKCCTC